MIKKEKIKKVKNKEANYLEKIISKIAGLGVPVLILLTAISATGFSGAAAITTALSSIGPFGIIGGISTLLLTALLSEGIAKYGMSAIFGGVVKELYKKGETKESILNKIEKYPVSKDLKRKLREDIETAG